MDGTQYGGQNVSSGKVQVLGLYGNAQTSDKGGPLDSCEFVLVTGTQALPDVTFNAGTQVLIPASMVPKGCRLYITSINKTATTGFSGGTAGTISLTIQGTDGTSNVATYTQTSLGTGVYTTLPATSPQTGETDVTGNLAAMGPSLPIGVGLQVLRANSTAGVCRLRIRGYFAP